MQINRSRRSTNRVAATPIDQATIAQTRLAEAKVLLAGSRATGIYGQLLEARADAIASAKALRHAAKGGLFQFEYSSGARHAQRAAQLIGRLNILWANMADGEPTAADWTRFERSAKGLAQRAMANLEQAHLAAYTGTHA